MRKTNIHKRLLSFLLVLFMLFTSVPVELGAQEISEETKAGENHAPVLNGEATEVFYKAHYGTGSTSYFYFNPSNYFTDEDGDALNYTVTKDGETVEEYSTLNYRVVISQPGIQEYKIIANDGKENSPEKKLVYYALKPSLNLSADSPLMQTGNTEYMYIYEEGKNTFDLSAKFEPEVDVELTYQLSDYASAAQKAAVSVDAATGQVIITKPESTLYNVNIYGMYGSEYLLSIALTIYPENPKMSQDIYEVTLAENEDLKKAVTLQNAFSHWYSSAFNYEVENPEIAEVTYGGSYGLSITPKQLGTTKVTATHSSISNIKTEFFVNVKGVSVAIEDNDGASVVLKAGKETTYQMLAKGTSANEAFAWTSSDEAVASVDENGVLTAKKEGNVYIKATSSLSTEDNPLVGGMYVQVKEEGKVYLDDISFENYTVFEGEEWSTKVSAFHPAQLTYDMQIKENNISTTNLYFVPTFDDINLKAVLSYQVNGGEYQTKELISGEKVNISNAYMTGLNVITIAVFPKEYEENVTTYTFNVTRPYYTTSTIRSVTLRPNGETAIAYPKYNNSVEGTLFKENEDGTLASWAGFSGSHYKYKAFIFGKRTSTITLTATFQNVNQYARIWTNGENPVEVVYNWATAPLTLDEDGVTEFTYEVVSEKTYVEKMAAGEDPFAIPEATYTIIVESVNPLGIDAQILSADFESGEYYKPGYDSDIYSHNVLLPAGQTTDTMTFTVPKGINVYKGNVSADNLMTAERQDEAGNNVFTTEVSGATVTINLETVSEEDPTVTGVSAYSFSLKERGTKDIVPDRIVEYLCLGSQYTNGSSYGMQPERTLLKGSSIVSLGNFGGYIVYAYDKPIKNDEKNPYGIDFTVYGNAFNASAGAAEPGNVLVSKDGETWYTLAGSMHYSDETTWDYSMTYTKTDTGASSWTASDGTSGTNYNYPREASYPYFSWDETKQSSITVTGVNLASTAKDAYGSASAVFPAFGYVDVNTFAAADGTAGNPYTGEHLKIGDGYDLDWAVDANGMPVDLDEISYIKISTASNIYAGMLGEKSPEVKTVCRTTNQADESVGTTAAPASIKINGADIRKKEGAENIFTASYTAQEALEIIVDVPEDTNVYVNDIYGTTVNFETAPEKKLLRVIVQSGEQAPYIALIELTEKPAAGTVIDTDNLVFEDILPEEIIGYVNISFMDYGIRNEAEAMEELYRTPLGTFIKDAKVPFAEGENMAEVALRLLNALDIEAEYSGTAENGFYLQGIKNLILGDVYYASLGEFDAGSQSGWMVSLNNWFMDQGASAFAVEDGDVIKFQYSCQWGADIGNDWMKGSAEITGVDFKEDYGTLSPAFDAEVVNYTYTVDEFAGNIALELLLENYSSVITSTVNGLEIGYKPMQNIQLENGSVIRIISEYPYAEGENDMITILVRTETEINEDMAYAKEAENLILAIGEVTVESREAIAFARMVYDSLTEEQKAFVKSYETLTAAEAALEKIEKTHPKVAEVYTATGNYLENLAKNSAPTVSSTGGDWLVLGLVRSGKEVSEEYYTNVVNYVRANINEAGQLHRAKSTENSRVILALTAAGYDVTNVDGYNLLKGLSDMKYLNIQGINGPVWALLALDAHDYTVPENTVTRESLIAGILAAQLADGGWSVSGSTADADMTAMAIQALAPYYEKDTEVKTAVDKALETLSAMQLTDGGFATAGADTASCESCAQVIVALTALGINPYTDGRFIKDGKSVLDALLSFAVAEGGFKHSLSGNRDGMATEQGYYALVAYQRLLEGQTALYNMSDVTIREKNPTIEKEPDNKEPDNKEPEIKEPENNTPAEPVIEIKKGQIYTVGNNTYKVTGSDTVSFTGIRKKSVKKVSIPKTVKIQDKNFKVTAIVDKALKDKKKVTTVIIGANVKTIGKEAFRNCKKLSKLTIRSTQLKKVGKNALKGIKSNAKIKVPSKKLSAYKKLFKNKGQGKKVTIRK
ncbi:MAG: Ig-like domain-containing protein [Lachnospiraceae bacterium]|nr:Ig-like domain-containing protein [Lachnospiraceae bacterium]